MSDNRNYSVITNFGCHWQCPYCIVRNTGIQIAETRMGATYDTVMDLADSGKMKFLSFSGGGDPLWGLDIRRAYWYMTPTRKECGGAMNDVDDSDHELTDEQRDKLRKAIGEIIGDFTPWILCVDTTPIIGDSRVSYSSNVSSEHASVYELIGLMESTKADFLQ